MTEAEWLAATDPRPMLEFLPKATSDRKRRLVIVACCRQLWNSLREDARRATTARWHKRVRAQFSEWQLDDPISLLEGAEQALDVAEKFADRLVKEPKLEAAGSLIEEAYSGIDQILDLILNERLPRNGRECAERERSVLSLTGIAISYRPSIRDLISSSDWEQVAQSTLKAQARAVRDSFGNPFRKVQVIRKWLTSTVVQLAEGIYQEQAFDRLPILADALQDAGCEDEQILNHCRQPGEHVRGCWVVDLVTGRK